MRIQILGKTTKDGIEYALIRNGIFEGSGVKKDLDGVVDLLDYSGPGNFIITMEPNGPMEGK